MRHLMPLAVVVLAMACGSALAGVVITSSHTNLATKETASVSGFIEADRLKIVTPQATVIFRSDLNKTWVIGTPSGTYVEITPEVVSALAARVAAAQQPGSAEQAKLQERLAKLPPAQRALAEQQLWSLGGAATGQQQVAYSKVGQGKSMPPGRCEVYAKTVDGQKQEDLCIASLSAVGLTPEDFRVLDLFAAFMGPLANSPVAPRADYLNWAEMSKAIGFSGIPLETTLLSVGKPSMMDAVQKIERVNVPTDAFELPAGLTRRELTSAR
jgi:hypothetical protein